jgi:8-oxo-dGTP diphosphatase|nr:NUDIX hydrolase [Bacillota bacterium]
MDRDRAFAAILLDGKIAMVRVDEKDRSYWTLPGGGVEEGESREEAAVREAMEETNLKIKIVRFLFQGKYAAGTEYCYLAEPTKGGQHIQLGHDPELEVNEQVLKQAEWIPIGDLKDDLHVTRVIKALSQEEIEKYKIDLQGCLDL